MDHTLSAKTAKFTSLENLYEYGSSLCYKYLYFIEMLWLTFQTRIPSNRIVESASRAALICVSSQGQHLGWFCLGLVARVCSQAMGQLARFSSLGSSILHYIYTAVSGMSQSQRLSRNLPSYEYINMNQI